MAEDRKYGKITTEFGNIGEDEPVIVFRARDSTLPNVLLWAISEATAYGSPIEHIEILLKTRQSIIKWQHQNLDKVQVPTSKNYIERMKDG